METFRELMIEQGASIGFVKGICTIRINENYVYQTIIEQFLEDLRSLIYSHGYISNYMKLQ
jgi:hypothetical protein